MLSELFLYVNGNEESVGDGSKVVLSFLEACNKLFENGFLSHGRISNMESDVLKSINNRYRSQDCFGAPVIYLYIYLCPHLKNIMSFIHVVLEEYTP